MTRLGQCYVKQSGCQKVEANKNFHLHDLRHTASAYAISVIGLLFFAAFAQAAPSDPDDAQCRQGDRDACYRLFKRDCAAGHPESCDALGGQEMIRGNLQAAERLYRQGCDRNRVFSCYGLGETLVKAGRKSESGPVFYKACIQGSQGGCKGAGNALDLPKEGPAMREDCKKQDIHACWILAYAEKEHGDVTKAIALFSRVCDHSKSSPQGDYRVACIDAEQLRLGPEKVNKIFSDKVQPYWQETRRSPGDVELLAVNIDCYSWYYLLPADKSQLPNQDILRHIIVASLAKDIEITIKDRPGDRRMPTNPPQTKDILSVPTVKEWLGQKTVNVLMHDEAYYRAHWRGLPTRTRAIDRLIEQYGIYLMFPPNQGCSPGAD